MCLLKSLKSQGKGNFRFIKASCKIIDFVFIWVTGRGGVVLVSVFCFFVFLFLDLFRFS